MILPVTRIAASDCARFARGGDGPTRLLRCALFRTVIFLILAGAQWAFSQPAITITPCAITCLTDLPGGVAGHAYPLIRFVAAGGTSPYSWSATGLPTGLTLNSAGGLSGTPRTAGSYNVTVKVTDATTPTALNGSRDFTLVVSGNATLTATPRSTLNVALGSPVSVQLNASGGVPPYTWSSAAGTLPAGLALSDSGLLAGSATSAGVFSFTAQVQDRTGMLATLPLSLTSGVAQTRVGALSQIASGGGWTTSVYLINNSATQVTLSVNFYSNDGAPMSLPVATALPDGPGPSGSNLAGLAAQLDPHSTLLIQTTGHSVEGVSGWTDVLASAPVAGYGVFDYVSPNGVPSQGTVPLVAAFQPAFELPYDNENGLTTAVALTNLSPAASSGVTATVWDARGVRLAQQNIDLPANGHTAFALTDLAPGVSGNRGTIQFSSATGTSITGLGLRVNPVAGLTSIPLIAGQ